MTEKIDLVYLWVDGSDPVWAAKKNAFMGKATATNTEATTKARVANNDELKYSLRSVEKYAPWVGQIFIVTDEQTPQFLNLSHPKIRLVDIREILPERALPCYSSPVIEYYLWRLPNLSERFIYANDDMFFNRLTEPDFFFNSSGQPIVRQNVKPFSHLRKLWKKVSGKKMSIYRQTIENSAKKIEEKFGKKYYSLPHHNIDSYQKSVYKATFEAFMSDFEALTENHIRTEADLQRVIFSYYPLATGEAEFRKSDSESALVVNIYKEDYRGILEKHNPYLFCMNDSQFCSDSDRERTKQFLAEYFPEKSEFEK